MKKNTDVLTAHKPIDLAAHEEKSAMIWSIRNINLPKKAKWDFQHRQWQADIFDDTSKELVVIKPTQIGMTTIFTCKMMHFARYHPVRAMYTLPRQQDYRDFVHGKFHPLIDGSPGIQEFFPNDKYSVDNIQAKAFADSFLHFMDSSTPPRMLDVDLLIHDEVDLSNQEYLEQYLARLDASQYAMRWAISTPSIESFGISAMYEDSDQKHWMVRCPRCGAEQELDWASNVKHVRDRTWMACADENCNCELTWQDIQAGKWVAKYPDRKTSGYAVSQLMVTSIPLEKLWNESKKISPSMFYNYRLGRAYTHSTGAITKELIQKNCLNDTHSHESVGDNYFLGADQGNDIHAVVGKVENGVLKIVHLEVIPINKGFNRLHEIMKAYRIRKCVVDALPNRHSSLEFCKAYSDRKALAAFYSVSPVGTYKERPNELIVDINRSAAIDAMFGKIIASKIWLYGSRNMFAPELKTCVNHLASMKRSEVSTRTAIGGEKTEVAWIHTGPDHFAHAINYLMIAADLAYEQKPFRVHALGQNKDKQKTVENVNLSRKPKTLRERLSERREKREKQMIW